jgi:hypothetical protein
MAVEREELTPPQRLAISRRALVRQLRQDDSIDDGDDPGPPDATQPQMARQHSVLDQFAWVGMARSMARRWWRRHPANAVGQLARPLLGRYAREQPAKLMAIAAATGALVVLVRPWRLLSVTAVLAAVLKTSDVADIVTTLMHNKPSPPRKDFP